MQYVSAKVSSPGVDGAGCPVMEGACNTIRLFVVFDANSGPWALNIYTSTQEKSCFYLSFLFIPWINTAEVFIFTLICIRQTSFRMEEAHPYILIPNKICQII